MTQTTAFHDDARLDEMEQHGGGFARAASYLRNVASVEARDAIVDEAHTMKNMCRDWRWADCVGHIETEYQQTGSVSTRYREMAGLARETG